MRHEQEIVFGQFRLDPAGERLYEGNRILRLRPKSFAVLRYLAERPGRLIPKAEILATVWTDTAVSEAVLKLCIREVREALSDDPAQPRFIETAHRRAYHCLSDNSHAAPAQQLPPP